MGNHGDPQAVAITARLDWTLDEGLPRPADQHYHVLRGISPTSLPQVHYYSILAAGPCDDLSSD